MAFARSAFVWLMAVSVSLGQDISISDQTDQVDYTILQQFCMSQPVTTNCPIDAQFCGSAKECPTNFACSCMQGCGNLSCLLPQNVQVCGCHPPPRNGYTLNRIDSVEFLCDPGYHLEGVTRKTCREGVWLPPQSFPKCSIRMCTELPTFANGNTFFNPTNEPQKFNTTATHSCSSGYSVFGNKQQTCQVDGTWSGQLPECRRDGYWSEYSEWSQCDAVCGQGLMRRNRTCNEPEEGGKPCPEGDDEEIDVCDTGKVCERALTDTAMATTQPSRKAATTTAIAVQSSEAENTDGEDRMPNTLRPAVLEAETTVDVSIHQPTAAQTTNTLLPTQPACTPPSKGLTQRQQRQLQQLRQQLGQKQRQLKQQQKQVEMARRLLKEQQRQMGTHCRRQEQQLQQLQQQWQQQQQQQQRQLQEQQQQQMRQIQQQQQLQQQQQQLKQQQQQQQRQWQQQQLQWQRQQQQLQLQRQQQQQQQQRQWQQQQLQWQQQQQQQQQQQHLATTSPCRPEATETPAYQQLEEAPTSVQRFNLSALSPTGHSGNGVFGMDWLRWVYSKFFPSLGRSNHRNVQTYKRHVALQIRKSLQQQRKQQQIDRAEQRRRQQQSNKKKPKTKKSKKPKKKPKKP